MEQKLVVLKVLDQCVRMMNIVCLNHEASPTRICGGLWLPDTHNSLLLYQL